ncbi:enhancer of mRNA-decapping protein 4-like [Dorcoceras hygrometricum]|uniref:Enhancer of mRNA-decapping protein 4-like n=1 Tax=Dorcoceras hygrometricum TaxID=472368 RepID=A0A2Z7C0K9_9LAMI|nr:enhancer of mRNA-decapping protein 4-like [Dorcoceras hygrometricum]
MTRGSMDGVLDRHNDLMKQLEDIRAEKDKEKESVLLELEIARAEAQSSKAQALRFEEENKNLQAEVERLKVEAENSWQLGKEKFLQSKEFDILCSGRASVFFEKGFDGCLAKFRANGYPEE